MVHVPFINGSACCSGMHWPLTTNTLLYLHPINDLEYERLRNFPSIPNYCPLFVSSDLFLKLFPRKSINQFVASVSTCLPTLIVLLKIQEASFMFSSFSVASKGSFVERSLFFFSKLPLDWESISSAFPGLSSDHFF